MKVFVTGGTGFVGSHVVTKLLDEGHDVVALVRETSDTSYLEQLGVDMVVGALGRAVELEQTLSQVDAVVHVAGMTSAIDAQRMYRVNAGGTRDLVDRVADFGGEGTRFIYISSVSAQGPTKAEAEGLEATIPQPVSHYGRSKLDGEGAVLAHRDDLKVTIVRPPVIYGPRDRDMFEVFQLADRRLSPILGGEERWLSVVHGEDVARAVSACLEAPGGGEVYCIDDGRRYTWRQLGEQIARAVGKRAVTIPLPRWIFAGAATIAEVGGSVLDVTATFNRDKYVEMIQPSWVCGHDEIRRDLGWEPKWDLAAGARQTATWYREQGWL